MRGFSAADAPLLDELAELLGVDDADERERARRRWRAQIADAQGALDILTGSAPQDLEDELDPEILMAYDLIDASQLAERQDVGQHQTTAERAAGDRTWTYGHVIVDEAQELSEMAWRMVMRRIPNRWMTLVGDIGADRRPGGYVVVATDPRTVCGRTVEAHRADRQLPHSGGDHGRRHGGFSPRSTPSRPCRGRCANPDSRRGRCRCPNPISRTPCARVCRRGDRTGHDRRDRGATTSSPHSPI